MSENNKTNRGKSNFPWSAGETSLISRRKFTKSLCLLSGGLALGITKMYSQSGQTKELLVCKVADLAVGEMRAFATDDNGDKPYILIHLSENEWRCFDQKCTHKGCLVKYVAEDKQVFCPCHKGVFNPENGAVVKGPPSKALPQLPVTIREGSVYVTLTT
ncbi:MAG: Rieske (2Fe-2S) protein [Tannerella sp.]|jgi:Rieske Fe-S protein|nr:Rieske (2Fe-2S) protein [Tannerella sp.]